MSNLQIREIEPTDFKKGYIKLLQKFASYETEITEQYFTNYFVTNPTTKIVVIEDTTSHEIIGGGTVFCMEKLHNSDNRMGFIQDVVINEKYRGKGLGKKLVNKLYEVGKANKCYKIILNCNPDVEDFYTKLGFTKKGFEFDKR